MSKTVIITGTSSGFGAELVLEFARKGWNVTATMRDPAMAPAAFHDLPSTLVTRMDITDEDTIRSAIRESEERFGPTDVLVNNAGYVLRGTLEETTLDQIRRQFDTNFFGPLAVTRQVLPGMRERGSGHIVNFSSLLGVVALPTVAAYTASKHALEGYSESLSYDLRGLGVDVTIVEPGVFATGMSTKGDQPTRELDAYSAGPALRATMYDFQVGNLRRAVETLVSIAGTPNPPQRLYVGHGLDTIRRRYQEHLDAWASVEDLTKATL
ncbi:MAG TPA: SDR family oxidoreductase [Streptomyces sp.]